MENLFSVAGKTAVITGGSSGIGAMIAEGFLKNGASVYITARKADRLNKMTEHLSQFGRCTAIQSDLSTSDGLISFANEIKSRESSVDILINNAGASWGAPIEEYPEAGWDKVMDINVKSLFFLTQQLLPQLVKAGTTDDPARVVNIASINGITHPMMPVYAYSASKAAVIQLTRHLAGDLVKSNINVNGIAPGFFPSNMTAFAAKDESMAEAIRGRIPRGRFGDQEDMAGTAIYLCSRASAWVCGHTIVLDGGMVAAAG